MAESARRKRGMKTAREVTAGLWEPKPDTPHLQVTVDHLFADIWTRPGLSIRDRRLVTIGVLAVLGKGNSLELQFEAGMRRKELTAEQVNEIVLHLAHYVGWPQVSATARAAE